MKLHEISISIIVIGLITLGVINYVTSLGEYNSKTADLSSMNNTIKSMDTTIAIADQIQGNLSSMILVHDALGLINVPYVMIQVGWGIFKLLIFTPISLIRSLSNDISTAVHENLGIDFPSWIISPAIAILIITLVAAAIYAFYKWKFED